MAIRPKLSFTDRTAPGLVGFFVATVGLGPRAAEVAALLVSGVTTDREIASRLNISHSRAHELVQCLLTRWGVDRRATLAVELALLASSPGAPLAKERPE